MASTTYESYGSVYGNTKEKMEAIESILAEGGLAVAYNDDGQSGTIILPTVHEDVNNLISGQTAPETVAEPEIVGVVETVDSTDTETDDSADTESETDE